MNIKNILVSFFILLIIVTITTYTIIKSMEKLVVNTEKLYNHPFIVSNTLSDIELRTVFIDETLRDAIYCKSDTELKDIAKKIEQEETLITKDFDTIYEHYLGEKSDIDSAYNALTHWHKMRNNVISLIHQGKINEAEKIIKERETENLYNLNGKIRTLKEFAFNKANEFHDKAVKNNGIDYILSVIFLAIFISSLIIIYIIFKLFNINKINNKQLDLIDKNILSIKLNLKEQVLDISNALCKILNKSKDEILNTKLEYFFNDKEDITSLKKQLSQGKTQICEIYILSNEVKYWFQVEIIPELSTTFNIKYFNIFLTSISNRKKLEQMAILDVLTNLYNRNYFETIFQKELNRAKRDNKTLSVLSLDIDYFKQYNDTYGHQEGDRVLKAVAKVLKNNTLRSYEYSFRVGGEEFIILSYHQSFQELESFTQNILNEVINLKIEHNTSKVSKYITISCGVGWFKPSSLISTDEVYKKVDDLLYLAKDSGRNQYISSEFD